MKVLGVVLFVIVAAGETLHAQQPDSLDKLAGDFWTWRARYAPFNGDDVPRMERLGGMRDWSRAKLDNPPAPFATCSVQNLASIRERLRKMATALVRSTTLKQQELNGAIERAADALEKFRGQLQEKVPTLPRQTALGRDAYVFFLRNVALMSFTPEELLAMGGQEWNRAVASEVYEKNRNKNVSPLKIADKIDNWIADAAAKESQIRDFLKKREILTVPDWVRHYTLRPTPEYLRSLGFSETDDFTSPSRLKE